MFGFLITIPCMLLNLNLIDFGQNGAPESYKNRLNCVITEYVDRVEDQNNLKFVTKTGCYDALIWDMGLQFESTADYGISESRKLILGLMDSLLMTLNTTPQLRPYLPNGALTNANIELRINFIGICKYDYPDPNQMKHVVYKNGKITYYIQGRNCLSELQMVREEPLELARYISPGPSYIDSCVF